MDNKQLIEKLERVLANNCALCLKTQHYHWNVTGLQFKSLHELFEEQYNDLFAAGDDIAEKIRMLGKKVSASFDIFSNLKNIKDGNDNASASEMVEELANDHNVVIQSLKEALTAAQNIKDDSTSDLLIDRIRVHEKAAWLLYSSM